MSLAIFTGQVQIAVTGVLQQMPNVGPLHQSVNLTAPNSNGGLLVAMVKPNGNPATDGTGDGVILNPGGINVIFPVGNVASIYIAGTAGDWVAYGAS